MPFAQVPARVRDAPGDGCALGLLPVPLALAPLASASPPDPLWIVGIYDDADFDDAVAAVVSKSAAVETVVLLRRPADIPAGEVRPSTLLGTGKCSSTTSIRAPPR